MDLYAATGDRSGGAPAVPCLRRGARTRARRPSALVHDRALRVEFRDAPEPAPRHVTSRDHRGPLGPGRGADPVRWSARDDVMAIATEACGPRRTRRRTTRRPRRRGRDRQDGRRRRDRRPCRRGRRHGARDTRLRRANAPSPTGRIVEALRRATGGCGQRRARRDARGGHAVRTRPAVPGHRRRRIARPTVAARRLGRGSWRPSRMG